MSIDRPNPQTAEKRWSFSSAFEGVSRFFGGKKEQREPQPDVERFSVLDGLKNTDKKYLIATYSYLRSKEALEREASQDKDVAASKSGNREGSHSQEKSNYTAAHIFDLFPEQLVNGEVSIDELQKLSELLTSEIQSRAEAPKAKKKRLTPEEQEYENQSRQYALEAMADRVKWRIKYHYDEVRQFRKLTPEEEQSLKDEALEAKSMKIAEKIKGAPSKFDAGLEIYIESLKTAIAQKEQAFLEKQRVLLRPEDVKKILELHPNDYEQMADRYEEVFARAALLEAHGLTKEAAIARNLEITFSPIDGNMLQTPEERLAYIEEQLNPEPLKAKWKEIKGTVRSEDFVAAEVIPDLLEKRVPFEEIIRQMHWFHVTGTYEQLDACKTVKRNIAGAYRREHVSFGNTAGPKWELVPELMKKLGDQFERFSAQLEATRAHLSSEEFEEKVHQFACDMMNKFLDIHPMLDGNGRTARSLREYIIARNLGHEKMNEYRGKKSGWNGSEKLRDLLRFGQQHLTQDRMQTYYGSAFAQEFKARAGEASSIRVDFYHEPLVAHLEATDIQQEVFGNAKIVSFAKHAKEIIDGKQTYGWY